jgi:hypothetical protein
VEVRITVNRPCAPPHRRCSAPHAWPDHRAQQSCRRSGRHLRQRSAARARRSRGSRRSLRRPHHGARLRRGVAVKAAIVSGLALVASVVTPVFADELVGPPPRDDVVAELEARSGQPAGKPLTRPNRASDSGWWRHRHELACRGVFGGTSSSSSAGTAARNARSHGARASCRAPPSAQPLVEVEGARSSA